jgi:non-ribosomal peptide synthetase component F
MVMSAACYPATAAAQPESRPVDLPDGPARPGFDINRFSNAGNGWFETFYVEKTESLSAVLEDQRVADDTRVLVLETATGKLALLTDQMAYHHIAQGRAGDKDWMATF